MAQTADMPELANERVEAVSEGHKMSRTQGRRLPAELLLAIGDQVSTQTPGMTEHRHADVLY